MIVIKYSLAERIKAELLIASTLIEALLNFEETEYLGAKKLFLYYLNQIMREFTLAYQVTQDKRFSDCEPILDSIKKAIEEEKLSFANQNTGLALSKITTICQETNSLLQKQGLI
ncbi:MAG: hypothetical protein ACFFC7_16760 [Candidatus Hermodarchaeota archaeon]